MTTMGKERGSNIAWIKSARELKTSLNIQVKKLEASSSKVKTQHFVVSDSGNENTTMTACEESRLRLLHFKILHNIYLTNILLCKMKIKASDKCKYCKAHDFIEHFFFHFKSLEGFWKCVEQYIFLKQQKIIIDEKVALFGVLGCDLYESKGTTENKINLGLLLAKLCISEVKYGISPSPMAVFETEIIFQLINTPLYFSICSMFYFCYIRIS